MKTFRFINPFTTAILSTMLAFVSLSGCQSTPPSTPAFTPPPSATATSTPAPTPTTAPTATPALPACVVTADAEYIISGNPDPNSVILVDDILRVYVNNELVTEVSQGGTCCPPAAPIRFHADTGDVLRVQAQDANNCYSLESLWLQKSDGSCLVQLNSDIEGPNCSSEPPLQLFFDQTFTLP